MPDATGLELIASELRDRDAESVLETSYFRDKAAITVTRETVQATLEHLRGKGFRFMASVHGVDYFPEEPRLGVHYELLDMLLELRPLEVAAEHVAGAQLTRAGLAGRAGAERLSLYLHSSAPRRQTYTNAIMSSAMKTIVSTSANVPNAFSWMATGNRKMTSMSNRMKSIATR